MKALMKTARGAGNIQLCDIPVPECLDDEVLIKIKAVGLCGSDLHIEQDAIPYEAPVVLGHEFCGVIAEKGRDVKGFEIGGRVVAENVASGCGKCEMCLTGHHQICATRKAQGIHINGGFAEYSACKQSNVYKIPDSISFEEAALMEPVTVCVHAILEQTPVKPGDVVLITGPGSIGIICAMIAKASGAEVILAGTGSDANRLEIARSLGIQRVVNIETEDLFAVVFAATNNAGADVVLECSGNAQSVFPNLCMLKARGVYNQIGVLSSDVHFNLNIILIKEATVKASLSHSDFAWKRAIKMVASRQISLKPLITHKFRLEEWEKAFQTFKNREGV
ncbi:MAG: alcohol dehydrogenase catalytic domain-containing protein, partial [Syntrophomonadaceae bacterium]|nr:alcohol dehydrogenase catalytic domain-containing protein [Syntrophomonadaceae bacterium]